jgi:hypothetical protein
MRFFLGDSDLWQRVKNRLALDFQLSCQIIDSNLTHPSSIFSELSRYVFIGTPRHQLQSARRQA